MKFETFYQVFELWLQHEDKQTEDEQKNYYDEDGNIVDENGKPLLLEDPEGIYSHNRGCNPFALDDQASLAESENSVDDDTIHFMASEEIETPPKRKLSLNNKQIELISN